MAEPGVNQEAYGTVPKEKAAVGNAGAYAIADNQKTMPSMKHVTFDPSSSTRVIGPRNAEGQMAGE